MKLTKMAMCVGVALALGACTLPPTLEGSAQDQDTTVAAPEIKTTYAMGEQVELVGALYVAQPLEKVQQRFGADQLCSNVTIYNPTDSILDFSLFDFKVQNPNGEQLNPSLTVEGALQTGSLAYEGRTSGLVCTDDQGPGDYAVILDPLWGWEEPVLWIQTL